MRAWIRRDTAFAALLGLATSAVVVWQNSRVAVLWDLSYVLEHATRIAAGDVPYRDFPIPYAPLTFLVQAAIIRLFGRHYVLHIAYAAIAGGAATALTYVIVRILRPSAALLLCAPLTILGIYCIFPHPFYDPDCCLAVLIALLLFLTKRHFAFGFAAVVPLFVKQNIGLPFLLAAVIVVLWTRNWRALVGVLCGLGVAVVLIATTAGLHNYIHWTFDFAGERRLPSMSDYFGIYNDVTLWWWVGVALIGVVLGKPWIATIPFLWSAIRFFVTDDPLEPQENLLRFWPLMMIVVWRRPRIVAFLVVAAILGAFLSQQTWGSTYGIWPLLTILIALVIDDSLIAAAIIAGVILLHAVPYVVNNERLTYAKVDEDFTTDFRELVVWTDQHIPRNDPILCLPGEDLFYFTTGRRPRVPVLMFDRTINPYSAAEIARFNVKWVIVKRRLQINGTPMPELPEVIALMKPALVARLHNYEVYREGSARQLSSFGGVYLQREGTSCTSRVVSAYPQRCSCSHHVQQFSHINRSDWSSSASMLRSPPRLNAMTPLSGFGDSLRIFTSSFSTEWFRTVNGSSTTLRTTLKPSMSNSSR